MSKDPLDKVGEAIKKTVDDAKDMIHEGQHRSEADAEKARRKLLSDEMTPGEKAGSVVNEAKQRTQAEIDAAKRNLRDKT
jgi:hypothetical protein